MELDIFIRNSLTSIIKGIKDSQQFAKENGAIVNPSHQWDSKGGIITTNIKKEGSTKTIAVSTISFDIAVTASATNQSDISGGINVLSLKIGGNEADKEEHITASRLKFEINVALPYEETEGFQQAFA